MSVGTAAHGSLVILRFTRIDRLVQKVHGPDIMDFTFSMNSTISSSRLRISEGHPFYFHTQPVFSDAASVHFFYWIELALGFVVPKFCSFFIYLSTVSVDPLHSVECL
jgi:hypothetical protein